MSLSTQILTNSDSVYRQLQTRNVEVFLIQIDCFNDEESSVTIPPEINSDCSLFFSLTPEVNTKLIELIITLDTLEALQIKVYLIIPYLPYARKDKVSDAKESLSVRAISQLISQSPSVKTISLVEIHNESSLEFFAKPVKSINTNSLFIDWLKSNYTEQNNFICVAPDQGSIVTNNDLANQLNIPLISGTKNRSGNSVKVTLSDDIIPDTHTAIIRDDMIDTGSTITATCHALFAKGLQKIIIYAAHGVFSQPSDDFIELINGERVTCVVSDTIEITNPALKSIISLPVTDWLLNY